MQRLFEDEVLKETDVDGKKVSIEKKFEYFDEMHFRKIILETLQPESENHFEAPDPEDEILDQLESTLVKIYSSI